jgi:hypothetical protein
VPPKPLPPRQASLLRKILEERYEMKITILVLMSFAATCFAQEKQADTVISIPRDTTICLQPMTGGFNVSW